MRRALLTRILPLYLLFTGLLLLALGLSTSGRIQDQQSRSVSEKLQMALQLLRPQLAPAGEGLEPAATSLPLLEEDFGMRAALFGAEGEVLWSHAPLPNDLPARLLVDDLAQDVTGAPLERRISTAGGEIRLIGATIQGSEQERRILVLWQPLPASTPAVRQTVIAIVTTGLIIFLLSGAFLLYIARQQTRPLARIQAAVNHFAEGELDYRLRLERPHELAAVARTLNSMAAQLSWQIARIRRQRNELEAILSAMVEGVIVLDDGLRIKSMNVAAARLFDVDQRAGLGKSVLQYLRNSELAEFAERTLASSRPVEESMMLYNRRIIHLQLHGSVVREEDQPAGALIVLNDISRLKRLENMRKDFVANVSHELKTPITSILGFVETLLDGAIEDTHSARRFLSIINDHTSRLSHIIEDLLSLSRLESFEQEIPRDWCTVEEIVNRTKADIASHAQSKQIRIVDSYAGTARAFVNQNLLEQALTNLVDNAVKYSDEGQQVRVDVRNSGGTLEIDVADAGIGIPREDVERIFERFYRVDRARSREMGGTGLGLAIVKHIALAHGGTVSVSSVAGEGSVFSMRVPARE